VPVPQGRPSALALCAACAAKQNPSLFLTEAQKLQKPGEANTTKNFSAMAMQGFVELSGGITCHAWNADMVNTVVFHSVHNLTFPCTLTADKTGTLSKQP